MYISYLHNSPLITQNYSMFIGILKAKIGREKIPFYTDFYSIQSWLHSTVPNLYVLVRGNGMGIKLELNGMEW